MKNDSVRTVNLMEKVCFNTENILIFSLTIEN